MLVRLDLLLPYVPKFFASEPSEDDTVSLDPLDYVGEGDSEAEAGSSSGRGAMSWRASLQENLTEALKGGHEAPSSSASFWDAADGEARGDGRTDGVRPASVKSGRSSSKSSSLHSISSSWF